MHDEIERSLVEDHHFLEGHLDEVISDLRYLRGNTSSDVIELIARMRQIVLEPDGDKRGQDFLRACDEFLVTANHRKTSIELLDISVIEASKLLHKLEKGIQAYKRAINQEVDSLRLERDLLQQKLGQRNKVHNPADRSIREHVAAITGNRCFYCDADLEQEKFHVDHIVPKNAGGPDHISNYVPACARCNSAKSDKPFAEFFLKAKAGAPQLTVVSNREDAA